MSEQLSGMHKWFHNFMIYFALWAFAAFAILFGIRFIASGVENGYEGFERVMLIIVNALLILLGLFAVKARFDLAALRRRAPKELLGICVAGAVLCLANYWVEDIAGDDFNRALIPTALILACWGIALYRYYKQRASIFTD